ncbi:TPA: hypothetical protein ACSK7M_000740 [Listeria innocua]|uniref:Lin0676 protein n=1 Tax=Listeria innocua serovar 6a (strain ATCC BAA-680 / CLIP 11262) TaxID=272626 RepID=Q92DY5_LISIN|nr:hypothetical protein [Listeria innocua]ECC1680793.1 hypothetical protein [Listeria innocua]EEQ0535934.1 hypothetical protein [Listeria innocua]EHD9218963.1 hypothetical protein [Listeria innocua]EHF3594589.1 hypothetical protein [Listeria innocua]EHF3597550.1 hypothetical protein [Listeria innocua]
MNKRRWIFSTVVAAFLLIIGGYLIYQQMKPKPFTEVVAEAKIDGYESGDELENASNVIVTGQLEKRGDSIIERASDDAVIGVSRMSTFKIAQVLKNETNDNLAKEMIIPVYENEGYDAKTNTTYHIAGYTKMEKEEKYLLLLQKDSEGDYYVPTAVIFGKINLDPNKRNELFPKNSETEAAVNQVQAEVLKNLENEIEREDK